jgi:hypothetical protein
MAATLKMISDDHARDRVLTPFCQTIAIHGLTIIAHHCSILITTGPQGNAGPAPKYLRSGAGLLRGNPRKSENPVGRTGRMERMGTLYRRPLRKIAPAVVSAAVSLCLIILSHDDHGRANERGRP